MRRRLTGNLLQAFCLASISEYAGYIIVLNLLVIINQEIGPDPDFVWVSLGYTLGIAISCLIWGRLRYAHVVVSDK